MLRNRTGLVQALAVLTLLSFSLDRAGGQTAAKSAGTQGPASLRALKTRPERTNYEETSRYQDVIDFMHAVAAASPRVHLTTYGFTFEGRALPLAVIGANDATPEAVKATGKTRIYVQGNIHAGEVEGKEACQEILRAIALGEHNAWFDSIVLLINPIFNADGNERINLTNRGSQNGPVGGMGQRANAQGLDLNRDFMKLEAPETRSFEMMMNRYDPHIVVDLHTTDGSAHAYQITYSPPLHPATAASVIDVLRNGLLPAVTKAIKTKDDMDFYYYGNIGGGRGPGPGGVPGERSGAPPGRGGASGGRGDVQAGRGDVQGGRGGERAFSTTEPTARYGINMVGLRSRLGILSETFSYLTFKDRIRAARRFVEEICNYAQQHGNDIRKATADADAVSIAGQEIGIVTQRGRPVKSADPVQILMTELTTEKNPYTGRDMRLRLDVRRPEMMYEYLTFEPEETTIAPRAYLVPPPPGLRLAQDRLEAHGINFAKLERDLTVKGEQFRIESSTLAEREYEGHRARTVTGKWELADLSVPAGTLVVPVNQPLGRLAVILLEPRSVDSLSAWGLLEDVLGRATQPQIFPIMRTQEPVAGIK